MPAALRRTTRPAAPEAPAAPARIMRPAQARARGEAAAQAEQTRAATATTRTSAYGNETVQDEQISLNTFPPGIEPSKLKVGVGKTINLGNYESLRIDVEMTSPCLESDKDEVFARSMEFCAEKLISEEREWLGAPQSKPKATRR